MEGTNVTENTVERKRVNENNVLRQSEMTNNLSKENKVHEIISDELRGKMQEIQQEVLEHVNDRMNNIVSEILQKVDKVTHKKTGDLVDPETYQDRIKSSTDILPSKQFVNRNSLLTDLYEIKHFRTIYNVFMSILIILFINTVAHDIKDGGSPNLGFGTIVLGFGKFPLVIYIWMLMKASTLAVYSAFSYWAHRRLEFHPKTPKIKVWDYTCLSGMILYEIVFVVLPAKAVLDEDLPVASSAIILMEQVRLIMKTYAFVRSAAPRFLSYKPHADVALPKVPSFSQFLYFMFAPTLVYQDSYPRTKKIRWKQIVSNFAEVILIIFTVTFIYERFLLARFREFGRQPMEYLEMITDIIGTIMPAIFFFLCGFYCLLHAWMNAFAELLTFADKMFYKDWWNATSLAAYYRTWNVVVHDWLYTYIYKDMYEIVTTRNKTASFCAVIIISAIVHEYIISFIFRFFFPVMLFHFGVIGLFFAVSVKISGNVFFWCSLLIGNGMILSLYCMEYFARLNCPSYRDDIIDLFLPRSAMCFLAPGTTEVS